MRIRKVVQKIREEIGKIWTKIQKIRKAKSPYLSLVGKLGKLNKIGKVYPEN